MAVMILVRRVMGDKLNRASFQIGQCDLGLMYPILAAIFVVPSLLSDRLSV